MKSVTISITIPEQLEKYMQNKADEVGISRSRQIGNILLAWQKDDMNGVRINRCKNLGALNECSVFNLICEAPQSEAITCAEFGRVGGD